MARRPGLQGDAGRGDDAGADEGPFAPEAVGEKRGLQRLSQIIRWAYSGTGEGVKWKRGAAYDETCEETPCLEG